MTRFLSDLPLAHKFALIAALAFLMLGLPSARVILGDLATLRSARQQAAVVDRMVDGSLAKAREPSCLARQAWRRARGAARQDHGRTPWAIGLQQVLASP